MADASLFCREASRADLANVLRLYAHRGFDDGVVLPPTEADRDRMASYSGHGIYVAVCDGRVVGTFALLVMDDLGHLGLPSAIIEDVAVDPEWQGRGVGKTMVRHALEAAGDKGCCKASLSTNMERARAFCDSPGFERHGYSFRTRVRRPAVGNGEGGARR